MRVLITRPRKDSQEFAEGLRRIGVEILFLPTIAIQPVEDPSLLDEALRNLSRYQWMVFTSANAVEAVLGRLKELEITGFPDSLRVAAVGPKTAARLAKAGYPVDFVPQEHTAEAILPGLGDLPDRRVLLPSGDLAHDTLPQAIRAAGGSPHVVTAYHTVPATLQAEDIAQLESGVDVITFMSGSAVQNFVSLLQSAQLDPLHLPGNPRIACISPKTALVANGAGFQADIVAGTYTADGLVRAIASYMEIEPQ
jgi:uroporphyrinogen-III synthase